MIFIDIFGFKLLKSTVNNLYSFIYLSKIILIQEKPRIINLYFHLEKITRDYLSAFASNALRKFCH